MHDTCLGALRDAFACVAWPISVGLILFLISCDACPSCPDTSDCFSLASGDGAQLESDLHIQVVPPIITINQVGAVALHLRNSSASTRREVNLGLILPEGIDSFLGSSTGGQCGGLLDFCGPGNQLVWAIPELPPGKRVTFLVPAKISSFFFDPAAGESITFAAASNWSGGGGLNATGTLRTATSNEVPPCLTGAVGTSHGDLNVTIAYDNPRKTGDQAEVTARIGVTNVSGAVMDSVTLRLVVPGNIGNFHGSEVGGACYGGLTGMCIPGGILTWVTGTLNAGETRNYSLPMRVATWQSPSVLLCAATVGRRGGGSFGCAAKDLR